MNAEAKTKSSGLNCPECAIPLFALNSWLYPGIPLQLQVFERRYLDMVTAQLKKDEGFGVVAIRKGQEVGGVPRVHPLGVMVELTDWEQRSNGLLGITVVGRQRFRVLTTEERDNGLLVAAAEFLEDEVGAELDEGVSGLLGVLAQLKQHQTVQAMNLPEVSDTANLSWQLAHVLPLSSTEKMALLALGDPLERLDYLSRKISSLSVE